MLFLFVTSCEQDDGLEILQIEVSQSPFKLKTVKLFEIPEIKDYLNSKTNNIFYKESTNKDGAIFDTENIMEVIDTLSYTNYSFRFVYPDTPIGTFYNLVVGKTPSGENIEPIVLKYVCDEDYLDEFVANNFYFGYFNGKILVHKYTDFFEDGNFYKGDPYCPPNFDVNGDPIPCDEIVVDNGSQTTGGGSENGDSTGGGTGEGGTTSGTGSSILEGNGGYGIEVVYPGPDLKSPRFFKLDGETKSKAMSLAKGDTTSDCPDCPTSVDGGVGVNTPNIIDFDPTFDLYPCQKEIVTSIYKNKSQLSNFIMDAFGGTQNDVNLTYKVEDLENISEIELVNAGTSKGVMDSDGELNLTISLDTQAAQEGSDLLIATVMIHENVHALLTYMNGMVNFNISSLKPSLNELAQAYAKWKVDNQLATVTETEHFYMTQLVDQMADALQEFGESKNYTISSEYYKSLCWSGDMKVHAPESIQSDINEAYLNERLLAGTSYSQGTKCN